MICSITRMLPPSPSRSLPSPPSEYETATSRWFGFSRKTSSLGVSAFTTRQPLSSKSSTICSFLDGNEIISPGNGKQKLGNFHDKTRGRFHRLKLRISGRDNQNEKEHEEREEFPPLFQDVTNSSSNKLLDFDAETASTNLKKSTERSSAQQREDDIILQHVPESIIAAIERVKTKHLSQTNPPPDLDKSPTGNDALLKQIVQAGMNRKNQNCEIEIHPLTYPTMERVPGCVATVHLQIALIPPSPSTSRDISTNGRERYRLQVDGTSDAMLSRGILALVSDMFRGVTAEDILNLEPDHLATAMGLRSVLSRGRNDGVASMVRVVQSQIRRLIDGDSKDVNVDGSSVNGNTKKAEQVAKQSTDAADQSTRKPTVAMLLSGGVDSSVALHLLLRQNYNVTAFYLRIWLEDELSNLGTCPWEDDLEVCQAVCEHAEDVNGGVGVTLETVSLGKEYRERVVRYTIEEAERGRTPNPDIMCNSRVKFGCFLEWIEENGMEFDYVASGHYARLEDGDIMCEEVNESEYNANGGNVKKKRLFRAPDPVKDQSYFLCALTQKQLSKVIFPLGQYHKSEVRDLAMQFELPNRNRPDSQGLCFLGKVKFDDFLASYLGNRPGDVVDASNGDIVGRHNGLWYHTVGQRKGIGKVMTPLATARGPWYVVAKDQSRDVVYVSNRYDEEDFARARSEFEVEDVRWISGRAPLEARGPIGEEGDWNEVRMEMKIRHGPKIVEGTLLLKGDGSSGNIRLDKKDGGLAPGQYVVFYHPGTEECLGAGVISEKHWANFLQNYNELIGSSS